MTPEQNQLIRKTDIGDIIVSESGDFIDLVYNETTRQAQEKARKIDCEITKKIRQDAIEAFRKGLLETLDDVELKETDCGYAYSLIESYSLPTK